MEFKDIFSKNVMNKELHYIARQSTLTNNIDIHTNDHKIIFSSYEYFKMSVIITIYNCLSDFNLKYFENKTITRDYVIIKKIVNDLTKGDVQWNDSENNKRCLMNLS